jgi:hypothetical protein
MLVLLVLAERYVSRQPLRFLDMAQLDWLSSGRAAAKKAPGYEVLCLGDSMVKFGLTPRVLAAESGRTVYSLALLDGKPAAAYFLLRRAIAAGARPRAVIINYSPEALNQSAESLLLNPRVNTFLASPAEAWELAQTYHDREFFGRLLAVRVLPSFRSRAHIRAEVTAALEGRSASHADENRPWQRNWQRNRGGVVLAKRPGFQGEIPRDWEGSLLSPDLKPQPEHAHYVRRLIRLAAEHGAAVYWLLPPNAPRVMAARDANGVHARFELFARGLLNQFANLTVIDARHADYGNGVFVDPVHLDRDGSRALSSDVADVLRTTLGHSQPGERWVSLPAYHDRPASASVRLEDVDQSRLALSRDTGTRTR